MKIGIAIASRKRPKEIADLLGLLRQQSLLPYRIAISVTDPDDLPSDLPQNGVQILIGSPGLCVQRNRAMAALSTDCDVVLFYDDDFIPSRRALQGVSELFSSDDQIAAATGLVLDDGVKKGGISLLDSINIVDRFDACDPPARLIEETPSTYGCNMAFRTRAVGALRFDERLPLYGWQEDVDFSSRVRKCGKVVYSNLFAGVHRGVPSGRSPGRALGYSQVVNPAYLVSKGTMPSGTAAKLIVRNLLANHLLALFPERHIDRAGRALGNWDGLFDVLTRKYRPENILRY